MLGKTSSHESRFSRSNPAQPGQIGSKPFEYETIFSSFLSFLLFSLLLYVLPLHSRNLRKIHSRKLLDLEIRRTWSPYVDFRRRNLSSTPLSLSLPILLLVVSSHAHFLFLYFFFTFCFFLFLDTSFHWSTKSTRDYFPRTIFPSRFFV